MTDTDIQIKIDAVSADASREIKKLTRDIDKMNKTIARGGRANVGQVGQMTRSFKSLTAHVSKLALIYGSFHTLLTSTVITAKFEESIKKLGVFSGTTAVELEELETKAKELGESTVFSASQVAEGMNEMALAGLKSGEMLDGIGDILNLAQVGMLDLKTASDFAVTSMKAFNLESKDIGDITDALAKASTISATNVTQLGQALSKVGQVANAYNVTLAQTAGALGILADAGRRGTEAGTQLKIVMQRLAGNKEALKYLDELGISMYDANNNLLPFTKQLSIVSERLSGMSEKARNIKLSQIFGSEASASAIALTNNYDKLLEKIKEIETAMVNDFATTSAKEMVDTLIGSYKNLTSALEGLAIKIMSELTPALRTMLGSWTEMVRGMDDDAIYDFAESIGFVVESITTLTSVMSSLASVSVGMLQDNQNLAKGVGILGVALKLMGKELRAMFATLMMNPVYAGLAGVIALTLFYTDAIENQSRAIKKQLELETERGKSFSKTVNLIVDATDRETGAIGKSNYERARLASSVASVLSKLREEERVLKQGSLTTQQFADKKETLRMQIESLDAQLVKIGGSWEKESKLIEEITNKQIVLNEVTEDALKNYGKFETFAQKRYSAVAKVIDKLEKKEEKLRDKVKTLEQDKLDIFKDYADKRASLNEEYDKLLYNARTKDLGEHEKYLADKQRATELITKANQALEKGNIDEASRYYGEAKSLATSFAGTVIEQEKKKKDATKNTFREMGGFSSSFANEVVGDNKKVLASSKQTFTEAEKIYKLTKAGEGAVLEKKKQAEIEANAEKMKFVQMELKAVLAQIESQEALAKSIENMAKVWAGKIGDFDSIKVFDTAKKQLRDLIAEASGAEINIKAKIEAPETSDFEAQIKAMEDRYVPTFKAKVEVDGDSLKDTEKEIENKDITAEVEYEPKLDKIDQLKLKLEKEIITADMMVTTENAKVSVNDVVNYTESQTPEFDTDSNTDPVVVSVNNIVSWINQQSASIDVYTNYHASGGGYIPQHLAGGGSFVGSGMVAGYDPTDSDSVNAKLTGGEFVVKREAVDAYGAGLLYAINSMKYQKPMGYADGGRVGASVSNIAPQLQMQPVTINFGGSSVSAQMSPEQVMEALQMGLNTYGGE